MQYGLFMMPMHLPEKPLAQAFDEDIDVLIRADALGRTCLLPASCRIFNRCG